MKIILEKSLDFMQFQNLFILTFCFVITLLAMINSLEIGEYLFIQISLFILSLIFIGILFTKKGLYKDYKNLYSAIFLFGFILSKRIIQTSGFQKIDVLKGRLSTNYNYSNNLRTLHHWEADLNVSQNIFNVCLVNENNFSSEKIIRLTKPKNVTTAVNFIIENTNLKSV